MCHHMSSHVTQHTNGMCHHTWTNDFTIVILHATARGFVGRDMEAERVAREMGASGSKSGCGGSKQEWLRWLDAREWRRTRRGVAGRWTCHAHPRRRSSSRFFGVKVFVGRLVHRIENVIAHSRGSREKNSTLPCEYNVRSHSKQKYRNTLNLLCEVM